MNKTKIFNIRNGYIKKYFKFIMAISAIVIILSMLVSPLFPINAKDISSDKIQKQNYKVGDTTILSNGCVSTFNGYTKDGKESWTAKIGVPTYIPGTETKIDTEWYLQDDGSYKSGSNIYTVSSVSGNIVVSDGVNTNKLTPDLKLIGGSWDGSDWKLQLVSNIPELVNDPDNDYYINNTLVYHYDSDIDLIVKLHEGILLYDFVLNSEISNDLEVSLNPSVTKGKKITYDIAVYDSNQTGIESLVDKSNDKIILKAEDIMELPKEKINKGVMLKLSNDELVNVQKEQIANGDKPQVVYPIVIDPTYNFISSASDGRIYSGVNELDYATINASSSGDVISNSSLTTDIGQYYYAPFSYPYLINRSYFYFDTSSLDNPGITITSGSVNLYGHSDISTTDFDITIESGMPNYPHDPLILNDFGRSFYTNGGGTLTTAGFSVVNYNTIPLSDPVGLSWINTTGTTKFCIRSSRDISATTPTGSEYIRVYTSESSGYQPYLSVTYTVVAIPPVITNSATTNKSITTAQLNSTLTNDGGEACTITFGWSTVSQGTNFGGYSNPGGTDPVLETTYNSVSTPYLNITGLTANTLYYFNVQATNSNSSTIGTELSFTTLSGISNNSITGNAYPGVDSVTLNWTPLSGSTNTYIYEQTVPFESVNPYLSDGTGTATGNGMSSPITLVNGINTITVSNAGTFDVVGVIGIAESGSATLADSPVVLGGLVNELDTGATTGTFTITITNVNLNPNLLYNYSFETGAPPDYWTGDSGTFSQSSTYAKIGTYSGKMIGDGTGFDYVWQSSYLIPTGTYTFGCWTKTTTANKERLMVYDGAVTNYSSYNTGSGNWEFLSVSITTDMGLIVCHPIYLDSTTATVYFDDAILIKGTTIPSTGTLIYSGTGSNYIHTGLESGTTYYYLLVAYDSGTGTFGYNNLYLSATTTAFTTTGGTIGIPDTPSDWEWATPPTTNKLSLITPFYAVSENLRADMNIPFGMFYLGWTFLTMIVVFMAVLFVNGSGIGALVASMFVLIIGVGLGTVPLVAGLIIGIICIALLLMMRGI